MTKRFITHLLNTGIGPGNLLLRRPAAWLRQRPRREQMLLLAGGACVVAYLIWLLLVQTLMNHLDLSERRLAAAHQDLQAVRVLAAELIAARQNIGTAGGTGSGAAGLAQRLDESAMASELRISALEPSADGQSVSARIDDASMAQVLRWLALLETDPRLTLETFSATPAAAGQLSVTVRARAL